MTYLQNLIGINLLGSIMVDMFLFTASEGDAFAIIVHAYGYILLTVIGAYYFIKIQFKNNYIKKILSQNFNLLNLN